MAMFPLPTGLDIEKLLEQGVMGAIWLAFGLIAFAIGWGINREKIKLVPFMYGDRGFLEIFGYRTGLLIQGGSWPYIEGLVTESKTTVRKQTIRIVRRDKIDNDMIITLIDLVIHVIDTKEKIRAAIYEFMDPANAGGLSDGVNLEFRRYIEMITCSAAMTLVEQNSLSNRACLVEQFEKLCGDRLDKVGVTIDEVFLIEHAPPNEYATAGALGQFIGVPVVNSPR